MDIKAIHDYGTMKIQVVKPGFGVTTGVYIIGKDLRDDVALRLLNNRNAKILELKLEKDEVIEHEQEQVSASSENNKEKVRGSRDSGKTGRRNKRKSTRSKKPRTTGSSLSKGSKGKSTSNGTSEDLWQIVSSDE